MNKKLLRERIAEADMVLVGIGEQLSVNKKIIRQTEPYMKYLNMQEEDALSWIEPYLFAHYLSRNTDEEIRRAYECLSDMLTGKNYFIITTCMDGKIYESSLKQDRIVAPCGGYSRLQCPDGCEALYEARMYTERIWEQLQEGRDNIIRPSCPECGKYLVFNNVESEGYREEVYLPMWEKYRMWLQGTLNRRLCVIELGAGMKYPSVIRWPFEKIVFFNQKASFYRIHSKLFQMTEELKERGNPIQADPREFLTI